MQRLILFIIGISFYGFCNAQLPQSAFSFNCTKDTTLACGQSCLTLQTTVPVIRASTNQYSVSRAACFKPNVSPATPGFSLGSRDDLYSPAIPLPFIFPFYDSIYNQAIVSTNGMISFDMTNAQMGAQWTILNGEGTLPTDAYDRAIIMGVYHDIDIQFPNTSPDKQIKYEVTGTAPHRKWVVSFYKVPNYQNLCWNKINNTYQVTLYEGLGLVEVHVFEREICATWNGGNAMIGMQNYDQDKGIMAPGRSAWTTPRWGGLNMNEAWRFAPNAGSPLLKRVELYRSSGEFVMMGDTTDDGNGNYNVSFNDVCPDSINSTYIVKSVYTKIDNPTEEVYGADTINVIDGQHITQARYDRSIYCKDEATMASPVIDGAGGYFEATPPGLIIDSLSGIIDIAASEAGHYLVTYFSSPIDSCTNRSSTNDIIIADSTQFVWTGRVSTGWENPDNWSCNNLPGSTSNVVIYSGIVIINSNVTINKLTIMPGASVTVSPGYNLTILNP